MFKTGLTLGKFMPPHVGHEYMIDFAASLCENLIVLVGGQETDVIPVSWRLRWLEDHYVNKSNIRFVLDRHDIPVTDVDENGTCTDPEFWKQWRQRLYWIMHRADEPNIDAIFTTIGGDDSIRILRYLDMESILKNPKIIMGCSDPTTFLSYLNLKGMVTFYGPCVMAGFAQMHNFGEELLSYYKKILFESSENIVFPSLSKWGEAYADWANPETLGCITDMRENTEGQFWLQGIKTTRGKLWGGCIEVLEFLKSTVYWPTENFWNDKILVIETSEEKPTVDFVKYCLRNYGVQGVLDKIQGVLIGRARSYTKEEKDDLYKKVIQIVAGEFGNNEIPIIANLDFGHTDPQLILPFGIETELNIENKTIRFLEEAFI